MTLRGYMTEQWGAVPPHQMLSISNHTARWRTHVCAECMAPIRIGDRYQRSVYRDNERNVLGQYKVHARGCPWICEGTGNGRTWL